MAASEKPHTIGVIGVRDFKGDLYTNHVYVTECFKQHVLKTLGAETKFRIVTGGGKGCESMIVDWAHQNQIDCRKIPPNIRELGQYKAFSIRNSHIVSQCDELVVFWDGVVDVVREALITAMHIKKKATLFPIQ